MQELGAEMLAIQLECVPEGTARAKKRRGYMFHLANDETLTVAGDYSPTSTYLIGLDGTIKARWFDRVHKRVSSAEILAALAR